MMDSNLFVKTTREDPVTGGCIHTYEHPCGMSVNLIPKYGFSKKFAGIAIPFGSIHNEFMHEGAKIALPAGTAHYMEHCIFSRDENGGLLSAMSALGANANAYTSNTHTLYYFSSAENFEEILDKYLQAVLHPYLGEDRVEAERDIIIQELGMYKDDPDSRIYNELLQSLYVNHPVREDIGGTAESVRQITSSHLKALSKKFYTPSSIILTVAGNIGESEILEIAGRFAVSTPDSIKPDEADYLFPDEPKETGGSKTEIVMDVSVESFILGFKNGGIDAARRLTGPEQIRNRRSGQLFWEMILGKSSEIYETLFSRGLINDSFGYHYVCDSTYSYLVAGGESPDPDKACAELRRMIRQAFRSLPNRQMAEEFEIQKRAAAGNFVRSLDSVEHCGLSEISAALAGINIFDFPDIYDNIRIEEIAGGMQFVLEDSAVSEAYIRRKG
ncbi:MAG: EF-P 5-aminopentanol modification-associated protein YfmH [Saccharofermentanales bacterium]